MLGSTLNPDDIKEGDDVYFECHVKANPAWRKLSWLHNVSNDFAQFVNCSFHWKPVFISVHSKEGYIQFSSNIQ
jgi:hypothetical protein